MASIETGFTPDHKEIKPVAAALVVRHVDTGQHAVAVWSKVLSARVGAHYSEFENPYTRMLHYGPRHFSLDLACGDFAIAPRRLSLQGDDPQIGLVLPDLNFLALPLPVEQPAQQADTATPDLAHLSNGDCPWCGAGLVFEARFCHMCGKVRQ